MPVSVVLDSAGRRRSPATLPGFHAGRAPRNKGMLYPADPPTVEEIVCVMRHASEDPHGWRLRAMIVMLWRGGLRVQEALTLSERDLDPQRVAPGMLAEMRLPGDPAPCDGVSRGSMVGADPCPACPLLFVSGRYSFPAIGAQMRLPEPFIALAQQAADGGRTRDLKLGKLRPYQ